MQVEFFEGRLRGKAFIANTDDLCAVRVAKLPNGAVLEVDRIPCLSVMTENVVAAVHARWLQELPMLKHRPKTMMCTCPRDDRQGTREYLSVFIGVDMLDGWKTFLTELLSRADSWHKIDWLNVGRS